MSGCPNTVVLAGSLRAAEAAAPLTDGDKTVVVDGDDPVGPDVAASRVAVSGDLHDAAWLADVLTRADAVLAPGGRVLLVVPAPPGAQEWKPAELPAGAAGRWRISGWVAEHPAAAVVLTRSVDDEGDERTEVEFRLAQLAVHLYRNPDAFAALALDLAQPIGLFPSSPSDPDAEAEAAELRRQLDAYRESTLGRLTTRYWRWRRRIRR